MLNTLITLLILLFGLAIIGSIIIVYTLTKQLKDESNESIILLIIISIVIIFLVVVIIGIIQESV